MTLRMGRCHDQFLALSNVHYVPNPRNSLCTHGAFAVSTRKMNEFAARVQSLFIAKIEQPATYSTPSEPSAKTDSRASQASKIDSNTQTRYTIPSRKPLALHVEKDCHGIRGSSDWTKAVEQTSLPVYGKSRWRT